MRVILEYALFLEFSSNEELDPDTAVKQLESLSATLQEMTPEERSIFLAVVEKVAGRESKPEVTKFLIEFSQIFGLDDSEVS